MNYAYLSDWADETKNFSASIEACHLVEDRFVISLKGKKYLFVVLNSADSFPYIGDETIVPDATKAMMSMLKNTQIVGVRMVDNDRIMYLDILFRDIYQQSINYVMILELMPPQANVILCQKRNDKLLIIDSLRKYSYAENPQRQVLPGLTYIPPKTAFKPSRDKPEKPYPDGSNSCNDYFKNRYEQVLKQQGINQRKQSQTAQLNRELKKLHKKLQLQQADLAEAEKADYWRDCAEALKPNLKNIEAGQAQFSTINYYDREMREIAVALQVDKSPVQNLQYYIKKYQKSRKGYTIILENIERTRMEIAKTEELLSRIAAGEELDLNLKTGASASQIIQKASIVDRLLSLKINDDWQIVIGRKAKDNDFITTQLGRPHDWWFHCRIYHGAHVLLRCFTKKNPSLELINHCCNLAAWYSQAKHSGNVPVDYTQIRHVRKPRKAAPGFVTYTNHHSVYATPMDLRELRELLSL